MKNEALIKGTDWPQGRVNAKVHACFESFTDGYGTVEVLDGTGREIWTTEARSTADA